MAGGFTSDVALDGALILSSECPPVGSDVLIEVLIPSPDHSGEELRIECVGKVTRTIDQPGCQLSASSSAIVSSAPRATMSAHGSQ